MLIQLKTELMFTRSIFLLRANIEPAWPTSVWQQWKTRKLCYLRHPAAQQQVRHVGKHQNCSIPSRQIWMAPAETVRTVTYILSHVSATRHGLPVVSSSLPQSLIIHPQIYSGKIPFYEIPNDFRVILSVTKGIRPFRVSYAVRKIHGDLDNKIWALIQACWDQLPAKRPNASQVVVYLCSPPESQMLDRGRRTFGVTLSEQVVRDDVEIPQVLMKCCEAIEKHGIREQGIYRVSVTGQKVMELKEMLDNGSLVNNSGRFSCQTTPPTDIDSVNLDDNEWRFDIHCVTAALKLWFCELPEPLITLNQQKGFIDAASKQTRT
jgi:RhoGAP domain